MPDIWKDHFPTNAEEASKFRAYTQLHALANSVLAVATTRVEGTWSAYCNSVPGMSHRKEAEEVLRHGCKLSEKVALVLFPELEGVPYAL
jgi:hypothetical protein